MNWFLDVANFYIFFSANTPIIHHLGIYFIIGLSLCYIRKLHSSKPEGLLCDLSEIFFLNEAG